MDGAIGSYIGEVIESFHRRPIWKRFGEDLGPILYVNSERCSSKIRAEFFLQPRRLPPLDRASAPHKPRLFGLFSLTR